MFSVFCPFLQLIWRVCIWIDCHKYSITWKDHRFINKVKKITYCKLLYDIEQRFSAIFCMNVWKCSGESTSNGPASCPTASKAFLLSSTTPVKPWKVTPLLRSLSRKQLFNFKLPLTWTIIIHLSIFIPCGGLHVGETHRLPSISGKLLPH